MTLRTLFKTTLILGISLLWTHQTHSIFNNNLFEPYDILLFRNIAPGAYFDVSVAYEGAYHARAFQADPDDRVFGPDHRQSSNVFRRPASVLQLWHNNQNLCNPLPNKTQAPTTDPLFDHIVNVPERKEDCHRLLVHADLEVPVNLMFAARFALPYNLTLAFYLPYRVVHLKHIRWQKPDEHPLSTELFDHVNKLERLTGIDLHNGWHREGIGDFSTVVWWSRFYQQHKEWLTGVDVGVRGGVIFPTGHRHHPDHLFSMPLGNDAGLGIVFGGTLEMSFGRYLALGIDGQFKHFTGTKEIRRIATNQSQTDLILPHKALAHTEPGFIQHYTLYLTLGGFKGLSSTLAYQHTRQHETALILDRPAFSSTLVNAAEHLQDWTTHSIVWMLNYDPYEWYPESYMPQVSLFVKKGFNGKRAILFDTAGILVNIHF
jgi:hypothetical protein